MMPIVPPIASPLGQLFEQVLFLGDNGAQRLGLPPERAFVAPADGERRYEIDDTPARILREPPPGVDIRLGDILYHPELYKAYPDIANLPVLYSPAMARGRAAYSYDIPRITVGPSSMQQPLLGSLLHEIQHDVQRREGLSRGTSPLREQINTPGIGPREAETRYFAAPGEVEAYDVSDRWYRRQNGRVLGEPKLKGYRP